MLGREDNEMLTRVGPGTPMGSLLRRFWIPALLASEIPEPDSPPVRVRLLGENLVAFRDSDGRIGILDRYCPHRRASLFWGRNEECGIRCAYHGWKFDVDGNCVDLPNVPNGGAIMKTIKTTAYPAIEQGGIVWCYMGPPEMRPGFPQAELFTVPDDHRYVQKMLMDCNWVQAMEGDIDSSHVSFLHRNLESDELPTGEKSTVFEDSSPRWTVEPTDYGMMLAARREAGPDEYAWRINQWLMPFTTLVAAPHGAPSITNIRVPIDDEHTMHIRLLSRYDKPLTENDHKLIKDGKLFPEMIPGTFETVANTSNDYLISREDQKNRSFSGIYCFVMQDYAVQSEQGIGPIADRSLEHLTPSDMAIVLVRRRLLEAAKGLASGVHPPEAANPEAYRVRSVDTHLPREVGVVEGTQPMTHPARENG